MTKFDFLPAGMASEVRREPRIPRRTADPQVHRLSLPGAVLARGFWLYVWTVVTATGDTVHYVGMTGDSSSPSAQSLFGRVSQHLGSNENASALRAHLERRGIDPVTCRSLDLTAYGPILPEADKFDDHRAHRGTVAALEKKLCDELKLDGYDVLNEVHCRQQIDGQLWQEVRDAFEDSFPRLRKATAARSGS